MVKFEVGNVVRAKAGGPLMTVNSVNESYNTVTVHWFDDCDLKSGTFDVNELLFEHK